MKKVLMLMASVLMVANVAMADHIGIYSDVSGGSCVVAPGTNPFVIHKFSANGTVGSRWRINTAGAPGTSILFFNPTAGFVATGTPGDDITVGYGACIPGTIVVGQVFFGSVGAGVLKIEPALGFPMIVNIACDFQEIAATGGNAYVGGADGPCGEVATEATTWGQVKALYR